MAFPLLGIPSEKFAVRTIEGRSLRAPGKENGENRSARRRAMVLRIRKTCGLFLLLLLAVGSLPARPASDTFLELGFYWGSFSGPRVKNATTTLADSKGHVIATAYGALPHINLPVAFDIYTVTIQAPAANGNPALSWSFTVPMGTNIPGFALSGYTAKIAFDSTGQHGAISASIAALF